VYHTPLRDRAPLRTHQSFLITRLLAKAVFTDNEAERHVSYASCFLVE
jgi:hypothetical protein